ncbi:hypothetical protein ACTXT7_001905 [Hymenolepis weldensis]
MPSYGTIDEIEHINEAHAEVDINGEEEGVQVEFSRKNTSIISTYVMHQMLRITEEVIVKNGLDRTKIDYSEAIFNIIKYGPQSLQRFKGKAKHTINAFLILTQIGFCCIYVLFVSQNIKYFIEVIWPTFNANLYLIGFLVALPLVLLNMKVSLRANAVPSALALMSMVIGLGLIFIYLFTTGLKDMSSLPAVNNSFEQVLSALGIFIFTFEGIALTLPIRNRMREPDQFVSTFGVLNVTMVITTCLCVTVGFFGYLHFGDDILDSITYNIPNTPATHLWPFNDENPLPSCSLTSKTICLSKVDESKSHAIAMLVPHLDLMVSLLGAISSSVLAILAPPILEIIHCWPEKEQIPMFYAKIVAKNALIISVGVFSAVFGTMATAFEIFGVMWQ